MKKKIAALVLGLAMIGAAAGGVYSYAEDNNSSADLSIAGEEETDDTEDDALSNSKAGTASTAELATNSEDAEDDSSEFSYSNVADVAEAVMPSIVAITNESVSQVQDWFRGQIYEIPSESAGSGIIVGKNDTELLICTNNHVVADSDTLTVTFANDTSVDAQLKGTDPDNDLAVVAVKLDDIDDDTMDAIKIARTGDSDDMRVGEQVVAIGNALGYGQSVTTGIISAKDRTITAGDEMSQNTTTYEGLIQTDAAINPGNSGGALLNMDGEVIGINSAKASEEGVEGMGYAIPISKAMPILEKLMNKVTRSKVDADEVGFIGISGEGVSAEAVQLYNVPEGIYITQVGNGTPADDAGLQKGDIISKFDDSEVSSMSDLQELLQYYKAGEKVDMTVETAKNGAYKEETVTITLGSRKDYNSQ